MAERSIPPPRWANLGGTARTAWAACRSPAWASASSGT